MLALTLTAIIGKLFAYDYLRTGWANIFYGNETATVSEETQSAEVQSSSNQTQQTEQTQQTDQSQESNQAQQTDQTQQASEAQQPEKPSETQQLLEDLKLTFDKITPEQLTEAGFKNAKIVKTNFSKRIFQLIDVSDVFNSDNGEFNISDDNGNIYVVITEMRFQTELEAEDFYNLLKKRAAGLPGLTINENNQFGNASFFINDPKRIGNAFLVVRIGNYAYSYTYPKVNHEFIKKLIILLNR